MRTVLNKIGEKVRALPLSKINEFLSVVLPDIETNIKVDDIINMVPKALNITIEDSLDGHMRLKVFGLIIMDQKISLVQPKH